MPKKLGGEGLGYERRSSLRWIRCGGWTWEAVGQGGGSLGCGERALTPHKSGRAAGAGPVLKEMVVREKGSGGWIRGEQGLGLVKAGKGRGQGGVLRWVP